MQERLKMTVIMESAKCRPWANQGTMTVIQKFSLSPLHTVMPVQSKKRMARRASKQRKTGRRMSARTRRIRSHHRNQQTGGLDGFSNSDFDEHHKRKRRGLWDYTRRKFKGLAIRASRLFKNLGMRSKNETKSLVSNKTSRDYKNTISALIDEGQKASDRISALNNKTEKSLSREIEQRKELEEAHKSLRQLTIRLQNGLQRVTSTVANSFSKEQEDDICLICMDNKADTTLWMCRHKVCSECQHRLFDNTGRGTCPVCRQTIFSSEYLKGLGINPT